MTLTEFLLARIAEDEAKVRGITSGADPDFYSGPDRIRVECEAKRRIVAAVTKADADGEACGEPISILGSAALDALGWLAAIWQDHPDYRDEWKP